MSCVGVNIGIGLDSIDGLSGASGSVGPITLVYDDWFWWW